MPVQYATDRSFDGYRQGKAAFGIKRGPLRYGRAVVSIPRRHREGQTERPAWWRLEFREDPAKHVMVQSSSLLTPAQWSDIVAERTGRSRRKRLLLFVHGYNVTFDDAVYRTAQIAFDVRFDGPALLFSWPSGGSMPKYGGDADNAVYAKPDLVAVLRRVLARSNAQEIYIIAHSMGNRVLTESLKEVGRTDPTAKARIKDVILAAPDIDADIFRGDIAEGLLAAAGHVTLYASDKDWALAASRLIRLSSYRRLGDATGGVTIYRPIDTIDASALGTDIIGHSYIANDPRALADMARLIEGDDPPGARGLQPRMQGGQPFWRFAPR